MHRLERLKFPRIKNLPRCQIRRIVKAKSIHRTRLSRLNMCRFHRLQRGPHSNLLRLDMRVGRNSVAMPLHKGMHQAVTCQEVMGKEAMGNGVMAKEAIGPPIRNGNPIRKCSGHHAYPCRGHLKVTINRDIKCLPIGHRPIDIPINTDKCNQSDHKETITEKPDS